MRLIPRLLQSLSYLFMGPVTSDVPTCVKPWLLAQHLVEARYWSWARTLMSLKCCNFNTG